MNKSEVANNRQRFFVHVDLGDGQPVVAGYHQIDQAHHLGWFVYAGSYCNNPNAFALDPINLPLVFGRRFQFPITRDACGVPGAFLDCGPDEWGKRILNAYAGIQPVSPADYLVLGSGLGVGALSFSDTVAYSDQPLADLTAKDLGHLSELYFSAIEFDSQNQIEDLNELERWLMPSSGIGGARPKAQVMHKGNKCIAKFNRRDDIFDNALGEYCMMQLAQEAGIECAVTHLEKTEHGHCILVERFDLLKEGLARRHMLSAHALLNVHKLEQLDQVSYDRIAVIGKQIGNDQTAAQAVFTRMLFNIAIGNTDDHSRNHAFLKDDEKLSYRLSPAYDLVPLPHRIGSHAIHLGPFGQMATADNIESSGRLMGLSAAKQQNCAQQVLAATQMLREKLIDWGISDKDWQTLEPCFAKGQLIRRIAEG